MMDAWIKEWEITWVSWGLNPPELFKHQALFDLGIFTESKESLSFVKIRINISCSRGMIFGGGNESEKDF